MDKIYLGEVQMSLEVQELFRSLKATLEVQES